MKYRYLLILALLPVALALVILIPRIKAETPLPQRKNPKAMAELIETLKIWKLVNAVDPTSDQAVPLLTKFNELEELKAQYRQEYRRAMKQLEQLKDAEVDSETKRAELQAALNHFRNLEENFIEQRKKTNEAINQILTLEQQVKFKVFIDSYRRDLKKTLQTLIALQNSASKGKLKDLNVGGTVSR